MDRLEDFAELIDRRVRLVDPSIEWMLLSAAHMRTHRLISAKTGVVTLSTCNIAVVLVVDACLWAIVVVKVADGDVLALVLGSFALVWMAQVSRQVRPVREFGDKVKRRMVDHG